MILVFESHPVQYRAPLYRRASESLGPGALRVVYGSDFSVRAYNDREFGEEITWRQDLLGGYCNHCLHTLRNERLDGFFSLGARGVAAELSTPAVSAVLLTSLRFQFDWAALIGARRRGLPVLLRQETQDAAFERAPWKNLIRDACYRIAYRLVDRALPIGRLNAAHYRRLGVAVRDDAFVRYGVPNPQAELTASDKWERRRLWRRSMGISEDAWVVGFSGKLIEKKDPMLLLEAVDRIRKNCSIPNLAAVVVGTGPLLGAMRERASDRELPVTFTGFIDQSAIGDAYLGMDCLMLPSRRLGETWGLVVNEALHAGCAVVMSEAVGCAAEFGEWERVRVVPIGNADAAAQALIELSAYPRDWNWCDRLMEPYSLEASAQALAHNFCDYIP